MRGAIRGARSGAKGKISRSMSGPRRGARSGVEWRRDRRELGLDNDGATSCIISRMVSGAVSGAVQWIDEGRKKRGGVRSGAIRAAVSGAMSSERSRKRGGAMSGSISRSMSGVDGRPRGLDNDGAMSGTMRGAVCRSMSDTMSRV